ncbi:alpha/beta hydrolase [Croceitalea rosinachiae]|uniref:Alpha/beta hydrolase n=1 Tax=Croceitalea rosinachiae TaxID=3075596 RepID=A0ABU3AGF4_9FLAO|nr:alpha/beta hydrolase [Croceitalea sp. F388]MDT0608188.1 alpha/beta hydrolase [Croceitalea sp. F388]
MRLQKGIVIDSVIVQDSINETFSLYLPKSFEMKGKWPALFVFDMEGKGVQTMAMFKDSAEKHGYILASPNNVHDSLTVSQNMVSTKLVMRQVTAMFPTNNSRIYTGGFDDGARFANLVPIFIKEVQGVLSIGASLVNTELLSAKSPFHFLGVVGNEDFNFTTLLEDEKVLNRLKFPNNLLFYEGGTEWPPSNYIDKALTLFDLSAISRGNTAIDSIFVQSNFNKEVHEIKALLRAKRLLLAERAMAEIISSNRTLINTDSLKDAQKDLKKDKLYRSLKRNQSAKLFKENLLREDFAYYLEEDVLTYNYNNLGWWNYQMTQIDNYISGDSRLEREMGKRLYGYVNALVEDNIDLLKVGQVLDEEALTLLLMLKTITAPDEFENYLNVVSIAAKNGDNGTALYYLEEVLKKGFKDKERIYSIEHSTLLRITPEFNKLVKKYLNDARYQIKDE